MSENLISQFDITSTSNLNSTTLTNSVNIDDIWFDFEIERFSVYPNYNNYQNVIFNIHWKHVSSYSAEGRNYWAERFYTTSINIDNITSFIPYEQLTKKDVEKWIIKDDFEEKKKVLLNSINNQVNPPIVVSLPSPF